MIKVDNLSGTVITQVTRRTYRTNGGKGMKLINSLPSNLPKSANGWCSFRSVKRRGISLESCLMICSAWKIGWIVHRAYCWCFRTPANQQPKHVFDTRRKLWSKVPNLPNRWLWNSFFHQQSLLLPFLFSSVTHWVPKWWSILLQLELFINI